MFDAGVCRSTVGVRSSVTWLRCVGVFSTRCEASSSGNSQGLRIHVYRSGLSLEYAFGSGFRRSSNTHGSGSRLVVKAVVPISKLCTNASFAESTIFSNSAVLMYLQKTNARRHFLLIFADFLLSRSRSIVRIWNRIRNVLWIRIQTGNETIGSTNFEHQLWLKSVCLLIYR